MKKVQLVDELQKRFVIQNNQLFLKKTTLSAEQQPNKQKKRITPEVIGQLGSQQLQQTAFQNKPQSNSIERLLEKADELDDYYRQRAGYDQYPN
jgi:hypothetical protein